MDSLIIVIFIPLIGTLSSVACYLIAEKKNNNPMFWALLGFVFGPLSLPFAALSSSSEKRR